MNPATSDELILVYFALSAIGFLGYVFVRLALHRIEKKLDEMTKGPK